MDPRLKIAYLVTLGVALFAVPGPPSPVFPAAEAPTPERLVAVLASAWGVQVVAGLLLLQPLLAAVGRVRAARLGRSARKLAGLLAVLALSYALVGPEGAYVARVPVGPWELPLSPDGALLGLVMAGRILALLWGSMLVQHSGEPGEMVRGLQGLGMPRVPALALDVALAILAAPDEEGGGGPHRAGPRRGGGRGDGSGGGRGRDLDRDRIAAEPDRIRTGTDAAPESGTKSGTGTPLRQILRGDMTPILEPLGRRLRQAERRAREVAPDLEPGAAQDLALIAGLAALSQSIRWIRILPGIPFAPGHKSVILLPLYVVAADRTRSRRGSTMLGATNGFLAFSFGDGQFGPFEILKFVAPGVAVDLLWPLARGRGAVAYAGLGLAAAVARFASVVAVGLLVQAPPVFWAMLAPIGIFHLVFGASSGFVTFHLLRALGPAATGEPWHASSEAKASTEPTSKPS